MAKIEIHIEDGQPDGVDVKVFLDPPINTDEEQTPAQMIATEIVEFLNVLGGEHVETSLDIEEVKSDPLV